MKITREIQLNLFLMPVLNLLSLTCNLEKALIKANIPITKKTIAII